MDVEGTASNGNSPTLNLEQGRDKGIQNDTSYDLATAHAIDRGINDYIPLILC